MKKKELTNTKETPMQQSEIERLHDQLNVCKEKNRQLLAENLDLKLENAQMKKRLKYYDLFSTDVCKMCVDRAINGRGKKHARN